MRPRGSTSTAPATRRTLIAAALLILAALVACGDDDGPGAAPSAPARATGTPGPTAVSTPGATPVPTYGPLPEVTLVKVADGFMRPTFVTNAGDGSQRLFVVEKRGVIQVVRGGEVDVQPFLDISAAVESGGNEQGLLGLAFHPDFEDNGRFFVYYTAAADGANTVAEYRASASGGRADAASGRVLFAIADKFSNHNGGMLAFGPDGYLYAGTGDGGSGGDPDGNGQDLGELLGKILRLDVDKGAPYGIPSTNPFVGRANARLEVWAYGLRNPWRFSFDRATGDLWIGDVGQGRVEEIDLQRAGSKGGENYGWNRMEGASCFQPANGCDETGLAPPLYDYGHDEGCSVTGGYVYRGGLNPRLAGAYLFADYCGGMLVGLRPDGAGNWSVEELGETVGTVSSFGEDEAGEVYLVSDRDGGVYRVTER